MKMLRRMLALLLMTACLFMNAASAAPRYGISGKAEKPIALERLTVSEILHQGQIGHVQPIKPPILDPDVKLPPMEALVAEESLPDGIEDIATKAYLKLVRDGVNGVRTKYDCKPLPLRDDLMLIAKTHALEMAKKGKSFHSKYNVDEAVRVGGYSLLKYGEGVGAAAAVHNFAIGGDSKQSALGIGAYTKMGADGVPYAFICVVASPEKHVPLIEVKP